MCLPGLSCVAISPPVTGIGGPTSQIRGPARPAPYIVAGVLITVAIVVPLIVPLYARRTPELFGFPFFFWFQIALMFVDAFLVAVSYKLVVTEDRRRRAAVRKPESTR